MSRVEKQKLELWLPSHQPNIIRPFCATFNGIFSVIRMAISCNSRPVRAVMMASDWGLSIIYLGFCLGPKIQFEISIYKLMVTPVLSSGLGIRQPWGRPSSEYFIFAWLFQIWWWVQFDLCSRLLTLIINCFTTQMSPGLFMLSFPCCVLVRSGVSIVSWCWVSWVFYDTLVSLCFPVVEGISVIKRCINRQ